MTEPKPRIAIAMVSTTRTAEAACMFSWMQILLQQHGWCEHLFFASSTYTVQGRNAVSFDLLDENPEGCGLCPVRGPHREMWDNVLLYDLDQVPPIHASDGASLLEHLQTVAHLPVVAGVVFMRAYPFPPIAYEVESWDASQRPLHVPLSKMRGYLKERGQFKVDAVGTGAMMVRKDVLVGMAEHKNFPAAALWETPSRAPADPSAPRKHWVLGEDLRFCQEVGELGYDIYMDTQFESGHVEDQIVGSRNYLMAADVAERQERMETSRRLAQVQQSGRLWTPRGPATPTGRLPTSS